METSITSSNEKSISSLIHLSTLCQYIIPLSNYILPLLIWSSKKESSEFINHQGKQTLNFQLSMLVYTLLLGIIAVPTFFYWLVNIISSVETSGNEVTFNTLFLNQDVTGVVVVGIVTFGLLILSKVTEFFLIIYAATKSANGVYFKYPLTINFIK